MQHNRVIQHLEHGPGNAKPINELMALMGTGSREIEDQIVNARNAGARIYWKNGSGYYLQNTQRD